MLPILKEAGFPESFDLPKEATKKQAEDAYTWLNCIYENEYNVLKIIMDLRTKEVWDRYDSWGGFDEHAEMKMRKVARRALKSCYKHRTSIFKHRTNIVKGKTKNVTETREEKSN